MEAALFKKVHPREYYRRFFKEEVRPDGRELLAVRATLVLKGVNRHAYGSSIVRLGNTSVSCNIIGEYSTPLEEKPRDGYLVYTVQVSRTSSLSHSFTICNEKANALHALVNETVGRERYLPLEQLCVVEGEIVWSLYVELTVLEYDGSAESACLLALVAALQDVRLPTVEVSEETGLPVPSSSRPISLEMSGVPLALCFSVFDGQLIADLTAEEEEIMDSRICVVIDSLGNIGKIDKTGGVAVSESQLRILLATAKHRVGSVLDMLATARQA
eukprot:CFRG1256T1